jgi:hypothetical protein
MADSGRMMDEHIDRMGLRQAQLTDPATNATVTLVKGILRTVEMALRDEDVDPAVIERVKRLIVYGSTPNRHDITEKLELRNQLVEQLSRGGLPHPARTPL